MKDLTLLKIGGSVITEKSKGVFDRAKHQEIERIAREISEARRSLGNLDLILVHGVGSFGHPYVEKYSLKGEKNIEGVIRTHLACKKLNILFCDQLIRQNLFPYPIHPFSSFRRGRKLEFDIELFTDAISEGLIPVTHGDMIYDRERRFFEVLSGDTIVSELAERLKRLKGFKFRIGMATDIDGVIFREKVLKEIKDIGLLESLEAEYKGLEGKSDVTGGMVGKLRSLIKVSRFADIEIFNGCKVGNVQRFLEGESIGTKIRLGDV